MTFLSVWGTSFEGLSDESGESKDGELRGAAKGAAGEEGKVGLGG